MDMIPVFKPLIEQPEFSAAQEALEMGWLGMGSYVGELERAIGSFLEAPDRHVAAVSTGHAALHLSLLVAGVGSGDEVITPAFNNIADFQAILACGAQPVFCDIDDRTLCIDLDAAEALITPATKAIIVMDYDCILCDHDRVASIAKKYNVRIIHDAAHALGSRYKGKMVGSFSDIAIFSFDPVKTITAIDGGAVVVRTEAELEQVQEMRFIGMKQRPSINYQNQRAWTYDVDRLGYRYHMANLHAAIALAQLRRFPEIAESRREACRYYNAQLERIPGVVVPRTAFDDVVPFLYYIRVDSDVRQQLREHMREDGIDTGIHWQPGHWFTLLKDCRRGDLSVTDRVGEEVLSLPLHSNMARETIDTVIGSVHSFFKERHVR
jgi:dTDP-4-amino-4,6-dideoxygalactose transaminase